MDVNTIYKLMKPHLDLLNPSEKVALSKLISTEKPLRVTCGHRKKLSLSKAKKHLEVFCQREMERERMERTAV